MNALNQLEMLYCRNALDVYLREKKYLLKSYNVNEKESIDDIKQTISDVALLSDKFTKTLFN